MLDTVVISGDYVCCSVVFGTLVGVFVFIVVWSELLLYMVSITSVMCYICNVVHMGCVMSVMCYTCNV